jgi:hypothetical protein
MFATSDPLVRFLTDGLMASIDSYRAGTLPLHRFAWELSARVETLASLDAPTRTLTRLRWLLRTVELVHVAQSARTAAGSAAVGPTAAGGPTAADLTATEENTLTVALADFRAVLATLFPRNPLDPAGAARPATVLSVVA